MLTEIFSSGILSELERRAVFEKSAKGCTLTSWAPTALCGLRTLQWEENKASSGLVLVGAS